jgi:hypothetical protein
LYGFAIGQKYDSLTAGQRIESGVIAYLPTSIAGNTLTYSLQVNGNGGESYSGHSMSITIGEGVVYPKFALQGVIYDKLRNGFQGYGGILCRAVIWTDKTLLYPTLSEFSVFIGHIPQSDSGDASSLEEKASRILNHTW